MVKFTLQAISCNMCYDVNNASVLKQIVYMPVKAFLTPAVSGDPGLQATKRAAGIDVISSREPEAAQLTNLYSCVLRQMYQQMINAGSHDDEARLRAINENTDGYVGSI